MARTPLLRAFARLAEEHSTAEQLGISPAELRGQRAEAAFDRGGFLKRAGIAGAGFAAVPASLGMSRMPRATAPRIAIVGGGIAGLNAALVLADKNVSATIYEAGTRIGGRMHSDTSGYFSNGQVSEYCGELIDTGHQTIRALARRFNLATVDLLAAEPSGSTDTYHFLGADYPVAQADADFHQIAPTLKSQLKAAGYPTTYASSTAMGRRLDAMSVYDWIENYVPNGHSSNLGRFLDAAYNEEYGAETRDQASLNLLYLLGYQTGQQFSIFGASDERFHISGGNERLPQAVASYLGGQNIKLGWAMQSIRTNTDGTISMAFSTPGANQTVTADHVILCMSFAVLRNLDTSGAGFDNLKKTAITQLGSGRNAKLNMQFSSRYWNAQGSNGTVYTDLGIQNTWDVTRGQSGSTGILVDYSGGNVAGGFAGSTPYSNAANNPKQVKAAVNQVLAKLENVFPGITQQWNGKASLSVPFLDPLLKCSYSYFRIGQYTGFSGYEKAQQGNIHFAGEHCSTDFQGYMEGGASEGARAANEVLAQT